LQQKKNSGGNKALTAAFILGGCIRTHTAPPWAQQPWGSRVHMQSLGCRCRRHLLFPLHMTATTMMATTSKKMQQQYLQCQDAIFSANRQEE
jgi:hypothetical protein